MKQIISLTVFFSVAVSCLPAQTVFNPADCYGAPCLVQYINKPGCIPPVSILTGTGNALQYVIVNENYIDSTLPFYNGYETVILKEKTRISEKPEGIK